MNEQTILTSDVERLAREIAQRVLRKIRARRQLAKLKRECTDAMARAIDEYERGQS